MNPTNLLFTTSLFDVGRLYQCMVNLISRGNKTKETKNKQEHEEEYRQKKSRFKRHGSFFIKIAFHDISPV